MEAYYLTTFTSRSAGETLLIDWGVTNGDVKSAIHHFEGKFIPQSMNLESGDCLKDCLRKRDWVKSY